MGSSYFWRWRGFCNDGYFFCCSSRGLVTTNCDSDALLNVIWRLLHLAARIYFITSAHSYEIEPNNLWSRRFLFNLMIKSPQIRCFFLVLKFVESPYACMLFKCLATQVGSLSWFTISEIYLLTIHFLWSNSPLVPSLLYLGMRVQLHFHLLYLAAVLIGRYNFHVLHSSSQFTHFTRTQKI